jgi:hypothetical protein
MALRHALEVPEEKVVDPLRRGFLPDFQGLCPSLA